jgi:two-component system sensor histidine kinase PilS (NtrC family)
MAWPWREQTAALGLSLSAYAIISAIAVLLVLTENRFRWHLLAGTFMAAQIVAELAVISGIVYLSGGVTSPSISLYLMTIVAAALFYRLAGTLIVATLASASFLTAVWIVAGHQATALWSTDGFGALGQLTDEQFSAVFLRLCIFFLCAFAGGYLAERLESKGVALEHTSEALKIAKHETGDILRHLHSGVLTVDISGQVVFFNSAAEEILGMSERAVRGRTLKEVFGYQFPELAERLGGVLRSRKMDIRTDLTLKRADGQTIPIGLSTSVLRGTGGNPRGVIAVFQDLTEAKALEEKIRAQDRLAAIGELSAGIAHEIRNPLAAISGSVEVLNRALDLEGENERLMSLIVRESTRLNRILGDFLLYARALPAVPGEACLAEVVDEAIELCRRQLEGQPGENPELMMEPFNRNLLVEADADHLKQVLINLLLNAIDACQADPQLGRDKITIQVGCPDTDDLACMTNNSAVAPEDLIAIAVKDTGPGIPASIQDRLFEPFVSSKPSGTGLGLAIAKRLIDNTGGFISATSCEGEGATITVYLRLSSGTAQGRPSPAKAAV